MATALRRPVAVLLFLGCLTYLLGANAQSDCNILKEITQSAPGDWPKEWTNETLTNCCAGLFGITCTPQSRIQRMYASVFLDWTAHLPQSFPSFVNCKILRIINRVTNLHGSIPDAIVGLDKLQQISLIAPPWTFNYMTEVSDHLFTLPTIRDISLAQNIFSKFPTNISNTLVHLDLGNNNYSGTVPEEIFNKPDSALRGIRLTGNMFQCPLGPNFLQMLRLTDNCDISMNLFTVTDGKLCGQLPINETLCHIFPQKLKNPIPLPTDADLDAKLTSPDGSMSIGVKGQHIHTQVLGPDNRKLYQTYELQGFGYGYYYREFYPIVSVQNVAFDRVVNITTTANSVTIIGEFTNGAKIKLYLLATPSTDPSLPANLKVALWIYDYNDRPDHLLLDPSNTTLVFGLATNIQMAFARDQQLSCISNFKQLSSCHSDLLDTEVTYTDEIDYLLTSFELRDPETKNSITKFTVYYELFYSIDSETTNKQFLHIVPDDYYHNVGSTPLILKAEAAGRPLPLVPLAGQFYSSVAALPFSNFEDFIFYDPNLSILWSPPPGDTPNEPATEQFNIAGVASGVAIGGTAAVVLILLLAIPAARARVFPFLDRPAEKLSVTEPMPGEKVPAKKRQWNNGQTDHLRDSYQG